MQRGKVVIVMVTFVTPRDISRFLLFITVSKTTTNKERHNISHNQALYKITF